jgi:uncharacterized protein (DUF4415 family)
MTKKEIDPHKPLTDAEWAALSGPVMHGLDGLPKVAKKAVLNTNFGGRPRSKNPKKIITVRLDPHIVEALRAKGKGWQTRLNAFLNSNVGLI